MKIIIDECVPSIVKRGLPARKIVTVQENGLGRSKEWPTASARRLRLRRVYHTRQNLRPRQNLTSFDLAVILLPSNQVPVVRALLPQIDKALDNIQPNDFKEI